MTKREKLIELGKDPKKLDGELVCSVYYELRNEPIRTCNKCEHFWVPELKHCQDEFLKEEV